MIRVLVLALALVAPAWAGGELAETEAVAWLQKIADSARKQAYEGVFVMQTGDRMKTVQIENRPGNASRLLVLDGQQREVRCYRNAAVTLVWDAKGQRMERRQGSRHFPDLLPENPARLVEHYTVRLGGLDRVAGQECRTLELVPKDQYRWGHVLCADQVTGLPLRAVTVDGEGRSLAQYAFTTLGKGTTDKKADLEPSAMAAADDARPLDASVVAIKTLPPGYLREVAIKRKLPNRDGEVEHWVFSDGLGHISLFVEPAPKNLIGLKGQSTRGMMNMLTRKVGPYQVTVLGDAPWPAIESVAMNLTPR
jgi:sigma-E factor negative regulatory protein RseB